MPVKLKQFLLSIAASILFFALAYAFVSIGTVTQIDKKPITKAERLDIIIRPKEMRRLNKHRDEAIKLGYLIQSEDSYVPALIKTKDKSFKAQVRLKGDITDHLQGKHWSFRVKLRGDNTIDGLRKFSLQHPSTRSFLGEWIIQKFMKSVGLFYLRTDFVKVSLNGTSLGTYNREEHFDSRLIAHNEGREGLIVGFDESLVWQDRANYPLEAANFFEMVSISSPRSFEARKVMESPVLRKQFESAIELLEGLRLGQLRASEVFNAEQLGKYFAILDIFGGHHSTAHTNFRAYYNPLVGYFDIIGFDHDALTRIFRLIGETFEDRKYGYMASDAIWKGIWDDRPLAESYLRALEKLSRKEVIEKFIKDNSKELEAHIINIADSIPDFQLRLEPVVQNSKFINNKLNANNMLEAYVKSYSNGLLEVANKHTLPLQVVSVEVNGIIQKINEEFILWPKKRLSPYEFKSLRLSSPLNQSKDLDIKINYSPLATAAVAQATAFPYLKPKVGTKESLPHLIRSLPQARNGLSINRKKKELMLSGNIRIDKAFAVPPNWSLRVAAGSQIDLVNSGYIQSWSPVHFIGNEDNTIKVFTSDGTGLGIQVLNAEIHSTVKHTVFEKFKNLNSHRQTFTGAVSFYKSPVKISHAHFNSLSAEDGLNLVHSDFDIKDTKFSNSFSDAFDADFSDGKITNSLFVGSKNDAIDVSGANVEISGVEVLSCGDKGISVGEASRAKIHNSKIKQCKSGAVSKDRSLLEIRSTKFESNFVAIAAYEKKSEFGPAKVEFTQVEMLNNQNNFIADLDSTLMAPYKMVYIIDTPELRNILKEIRGK